MKNDFEKLIQTVGDVFHGTGKVIEPIRESTFKRFPTLFTLLTTLGATMTFFGIERILGETTWLNDRPFLMLCAGLLVLVLTGRLYKKLG